MSTYVELDALLADDSTATSTTAGVGRMRRGWFRTTEPVVNLPPAELVFAKAPTQRNTAGVASTAAVSVASNQPATQTQPTQQTHQSQPAQQSQHSQSTQQTQQSSNHQQRSTARQPQLQPHVQTPTPAPNQQARQQRAATRVDDTASRSDVAATSDDALRKRAAAVPTRVAPQSTNGGQPTPAKQRVLDPRRPSLERIHTKDFWMPDEVCACACAVSSFVVRVCFIHFVLCTKTNPLRCVFCSGCRAMLRMRGAVHDVLSASPLSSVRPNILQELHAISRRSAPVSLLYRSHALAAAFLDVELCVVVGGVVVIVVVGGGCSRVERVSQRS